MSGRPPASFRPRRWRAALAGVVTALAAAALPAPAAADGYHVHSCRVGETGPFVSMRAWQRVSDMRGPIYRTECSELSTAAALELSGDYSGDQTVAFQFVEPDGTEFRTLRWRGGTWDTGHTGIVTAHVSTGGNDEVSTSTGLNGDVRSHVVPESTRVMELRLRVQGNVSVPNFYRFQFSEIDVLLEDLSAPTASNARGTLTTNGYKSGSTSITVDAADIGSGVRYARLLVDGVPTESSMIGAQAGYACAPVAGERNYDVAQPCSPTATPTLTLNTLGLSDGPHTVELQLEDASAGRRTVYSRTLLVNNPNGDVPDTPCTDGIDNDGDGKIDHGDDPGCVSEGDQSELQPPVAVSAPDVSGIAAVGSRLAAVAGGATWEDGPGTGAVTTRRWQVVRYDGTTVDIPGATGPTLQLTDAQIGRRIALVETRTTSEGATSKASALTATVTAADGTLPACADGIDNDDDNLIDHDDDLGCSSRMDTTEDLLGAHDDLDGDGIPNGDDPDDDGDGTPDTSDPAPQDPDTGGVNEDFDGDGIPNGTDEDDDNDGVRDNDDPAPYNPLIPNHTPSTGGGTTPEVKPGNTRETVVVKEQPVHITAPTTPVVLGPADNGGAATNRVLVSVKGRQVRNVAHGETTVMVGRIVNENGQPIVGGVVTIEERPFIPGGGPMKGVAFAPVIPAKPVKTDAEGNFRYVIPPKHSRIIRFGYKARTSDRDFSAVEDLTLIVRSKASLKADRSRLRNGQSVTFSGRLLGGMVPPTGVEVVLQAQTSRGWMSFKTIRTNASGRYASRYRFTATSGTRTYRFRAQVKSDSGYPWAASTTRSISVQVRG
jgi:hypothetical protein